ncbi:hypothetical protein HJG60_010238 [Phyllostomus discolor]|uniref:Uncharacterized protein n=1 Tax=Phyllostomus discolor TaxID=89673 RepID=A0A834AY06_9CHIR|nr:hypothetical protein HJG60_010238 [Phyllostomus discolor]
MWGRGGSGAGENNGGSSIPLDSDPYLGFQAASSALVHNRYPSGSASRSLCTQGSPLPSCAPDGFCTDFTPNLPPTSARRRPEPAPHCLARLLLPVRMNASTSTSWLPDFHSDKSSAGSGCYSDSKLLL